MNRADGAPVESGLDRSPFTPSASGGLSSRESTQCDNPGLHGRGWSSKVDCSGEPIRFVAQIRHWNAEKSSGLAVVDIPAPEVDAISGLKQVRVRGTIGLAAFVSNVMPAGGGRLAPSVSRAMMTAAGVSVGDAAGFEITAVGGD